MIEAAFRNQRREFRAKAACPCRLVDDEAAPGFLHRLLDRLDIERHQCPEVDHFGVDLLIVDHSKHDMHHRAVGEDRDVRSRAPDRRSEEHTSELQSLMRISYAVFCLKKKKQKSISTQLTHNTRQYT